MANFLLEIYKDIASRYELTNRLLTFGLDILWRRKAVAIASTARKGKWLDICTGTGEFAIALKEKAEKETVVYATDFSPHMINIAKNKKEAKDILFAQANSYKLPFNDNSFDLVTISFALRNLKSGSKDFSAVFKEIFRILKPSGRFVNIETSQSESLFLKSIFRLYIKYITPSFGGLISKSPKGFKYLSKSILNFHSANELSEIIKEGGFESVDYTNLFFGMVAVHKTEK